ncbi:MAG: hypothetical protein AAF843_15975 [Bacteroidota bacterium]
MKAVTFILIAVTSYSWGQDTLLTNYPNTSQVWRKVLSGKQKIEETVFYDSGQPWMTATYNEDSEYWRWYHQNGNLFWEAKIVDNKIQGRYRIWYDNGQLAERLHFVDNLENGPAEFYYPNGQCAISGNYTSGIMTGQWLFFTENGSDANGKWVWPFAALPDENRMEGHLKNGEPVGLWHYQTTAGKNATGHQIFKMEIGAINQKDGPKL